jgi:hypothetical protein
MAGNLEFIKSASGTSVSSLSVTDCFSADYDVYYIDIVKANAPTTDTQLQVRVINSSGVVSTSNYDEATLQMKSNATFVETRNTNTSRLADIVELDSAIDSGTGLSLYVYSPYNSSTYTFFFHQSGSWNGNLKGFKGNGVYKVEEQITGIHFLAGVTQNLTELEINVYGLARN